ncbi:hypothetical protein WDW86_11425 [Bdellovibrionota bacterium FG-2]
MEKPAISEKKTKALPKRPSYASIRVRRETHRQIESHIEKINKKDLGRRIRAEEFLALALSLITPQHLEQLQEASLTNGDRLERDLRAYTAENGPISRDEYLGKRLTGEIPPPKTKIPLTT